MNPRLIKYYLLYLLKAQNRHGLHPPFVYQLLDEVIYRKRCRKIYAEMEQAAQLLPDDGKVRFSNKINRLLFRFAEHFESQSIAFTADVSNLTRLYILRGAAKAEVITGSHAQCLVCDAATLSYNFEAMQPGDMLIVTHPYHSSAAVANWRRIKQNPNVTVTIDLFEFGLAFCRPQQRENFMLRF